MKVVTSEFVESILRSGGLTDAQERVRRSTAHRGDKAHWDRFSTWSLICEEVLDTEHDPDWYDDILAELTRRGFDFETIDRMRRFAWETAGWLNYDKMLWEWCALDEDDIRRALDWQLEDGLITAERHAERVSYIEDPSRLPAPACSWPRTVFERIW